MPTPAPGKYSEEIILGVKAPHAANDLKGLDQAITKLAALERKFSSVVSQAERFAAVMKTTGNQISSAFNPGGGGVLGSNFTSQMQQLQAGARLLRDLRVGNKEDPAKLVQRVFGDKFNQRAVRYNPKTEEVVGTTETTNYEGIRQATDKAFAQAEKDRKDRANKEAKAMRENLALKEAWAKEAAQKEAQIIKEQENAYNKATKLGVTAASRANKAAALRRERQEEREGGAMSMFDAARKARDKRIAEETRAAKEVFEHREALAKAEADNLARVEKEKVNAYNKATKEGVTAASRANDAAQLRRKRIEERMMRGEDSASSSDRQRYQASLQHMARWRAQSASGITGDSATERRVMEKQIEAQASRFNAENAAALKNAAARRAKGLSGDARESARGDARFFRGEEVKHLTAMAAAERQAAAAAVSHAEAQRYIGKNLVQNVAHVTAWTAAVGVLYGSLRAAKAAMASLTEVGYQQARLNQVFRDGEPQARKLGSAVLQLASANGRSSGEAMEAAIQWSRLGLNRVQVQEAVNVSLRAANVAEISAAEATDNLSSIYAIYGLRVGQLESVLGMLNATSNTYNVTNKDLFDGLSRTAAVAKQAGVGLAELIGILGAGVGATGQTGANIGNAFKSITGAMTSPDKLKLLRESFNFEATDKGDVRNMSEVLNELFVAYTKMNQAERQSMLFGVAGKNQASRMAAILDNYVQSQVLAINAQLNLNSAEQENARIMDTMKAQTQALATEMERFANIQGSRAGGPVTLIKESEKALRGVLGLLNAGGGGVATGLLLILTAIGAKMAMIATMSAKAGKGNGILSMIGNTRQGFTQLGGAMRGAYQEAILGGAFSAMGSARRNEAFVTGYSGLSGKEKALGAGVVVGKFAAGMIAVELALSVFNKTMEAVGITTADTEESLSKYLTVIEKTGKSSEAYSMQGRLFATGAKVFAGGSLAERVRFSSQAASAFNPITGDDTEEQAKAKKRLNDELSREAISIAKIDDSEVRKGKAQEFWGKRQQEALKASMDMRIKERVEISKAIGLNDAAIKKQENLPGWRRSEQTLSLLKARRQELTERRASSYVGETADNEARVEAFRQSDVRFRAFQKSLSLRGEATDSFYGMLPGSGEVDRLNYRKAASQSKLSDLQAQLDAVNGVLKSSGSPDSEMARLTQRKAVLEEVQRVQREEYGSLPLSTFQGMGALSSPFVQAGTFLGTGDFVGGRSVGGMFDTANNIQAQMAYTESQLKDVTDQLAKLGSGANTDLIEKQRDLVKAVDEQKVSLAAGFGPDAYYMAQRQDNTARSLSMASATSAASRIGLTEGDQFVSQQSFLQGSIRYQTTRPDRNDESRLTAMKHSVDLYENMTRAAERVRQLKTDELNLTLQINRENQRALMGSGPAEMLRKLAVRQMTKGGRMGVGSFFSLDEGARGDVTSDPQHNQQLIDMRRSRGQMEGWLNSMTPEQREKIRQGGITGRANTAKELAPNMPDNGLGALAEKVGNVVGKFASLDGILDVVNKKLMAFGGNLPANPNNPSRS